MSLCCQGLHIFTQIMLRPIHFCIPVTFNPVFVSRSIWLNRFFSVVFAVTWLFLAGCASLQVPLAWRLLLSPFPLAVATEVKPFCCQGLERWIFPLYCTTRVSWYKQRWGGVHILLLGSKECTWQKYINSQEPEFSLPLSKFKMCSALWSAAIWRYFLANI